MLVVFLLLVFILRKFAWKPIINGLNDREKDIQSAFDMAVETRAEMAKLKSDNEKLIAEANAARDKIIRDAKEASERMIAEAKEKASIAGQKEMELAREAIRNEQNGRHCKHEKKRLLCCRFQIAEKVLGRELSDKAAQQKLIADLASNAKMN